jgi:hypothetical protein
VARRARAREWGDIERTGFGPEALPADDVVDTSRRTHDMLIMSYDVDGFHD